MSKSKILFQLTGSIACFKACQLISKLVQSGYEVQTVASKSALQFVGAATLEGLTGKPIYSDLWENGRMMDHINLNRWADLILVAPATANYLNKSANGIADDLLSTLFLAHDFQKPFLIAPAMNFAMYTHPTTQKSILRLQEMGIEVLPTEAGNLACGEVGEGRLLDPEKIFSAIEQKLNPAPVVQKILITAGGTTEPIDDVRVITNISTGKTAAALAEHFSRQNYAVTFLHAKNSAKPSLSNSRNIKAIEFLTCQDLQTALKTELKNHYDIIIHLAAVSDYSVEKQAGKISSEQQQLTLTLKKNEKIVNRIREWSVNPEVKVVAFKMTSTLDEVKQFTAVQKLMTESKADLVVHNDTHQMTAEHHAFHLYMQNQKLVDARNKFELAQKLEDSLKEMTP
jgi:phosphopantothenoylcysteine decarboxylase/phosphopantothenate--cysteine ligase